MRSSAVQNRTRMEISLATVYRHLTSLHEIEASAEHHSLARAARNRSFHDIRITIELDGVCGACS